MIQDDALDCLDVELEAEAFDGSDLAAERRRRLHRLDVSEPLIVRAFRGERLERPPVWLMRQAGRYLPEYRAIRERHTFLEVCRQPELAAEATLQPIRRYGMDAAILFSDILLVLDAMGAELRFGDHGPWFEKPIRSIYEISHLHEVEPERDLPYVQETIAAVLEELPLGTPLLGFAGSPFTLLTYLVEGRGERAATTVRAMLLSEPKLTQNILDRITDAVIAQLSAQVGAGVAAVQVFESSGQLLTRELWRRHAAPCVRRIAKAIQNLGVPLVYFTRGTARLLPYLKESGADVFSIDWNVELACARAVLGPDVALQGNLDPAILLTTPEVVRAATSRLIEAGRCRGHIVNLGHGIVPGTDPDLVGVLVDTVQSSSSA